MKPDDPVLFKCMTPKCKWEKRGVMRGAQLWCPTCGGMLLVSQLDIDEPAVDEEE